MKDKLAVLAEQRYQLPYDMLTSEQQDELLSEYARLEGTYNDFEGQRSDAEANREFGQELVLKDPSQMIQTGGLHHANWGGAFGDLARTYVGAKKMKEANKRLGEISEEQGTATAATGDLAAEEARKKRNWYLHLLGN